jgi:hypothetical protein
VVGAGRSVSYKVTIKRTTGTLGTWAFGSLTWLDLRGHGVRSPIAVRPVVVAAQAKITKSGVSGSVKLPLRTGFTGNLVTRVFGLAAATVTTKPLVGATTSFNPAAPAEGPAVAKVRVTVPAGTTLARVATFGADYGPGSDLDVYVYTAAGVMVGQSAGGSAEETVDLPGPGDYDVFVAQFALPTGVDQQQLKLNTFIVPSAATGNLTVTPASQPVVSGGQASVTATWTGLTAGRHYLGQIVYSEGGTPRATTLIAVDS